MAKPTTDDSVLRKIEGLVHEEQHLYGKAELADHDQVRLEEIRVELDQVLGSPAPAGCTARVRPRSERGQGASGVGRRAI